MNRTHKKWMPFLFFFTFLMTSVDGQVLQNYIEKAWQKNEALKAKSFDLKAAEYAYLEAKAMYGPSLAFNTNYTLAAGGRNISFPIGDLLNPVYNTLNTLTNSQQFTLLENQQINFFPNNFYDAKFNLTQPIYYPDLALNKKLKGYEADIKSLEVKAFKRQLSKEVMSAAFKVESARAIVNIYGEADKLLAEAKRATQSMVNNDMAPISSLRRIEAQMAEVEASMIDATSQLANAHIYFEFLTGDTLAAGAIASLPELPVMDLNGQSDREEILQLAKANDMSNLAIEKENNFYKPRLGAQLSLGSQDFNFGWQPYALFAMNLDIHLFDNRRHKHRTDLTKAKLQEQQLQLNHVQTLLDIETRTTENQLRASLLAVKTFEPRVKSSQQFYKDIYTKYKEGTAGYLELVDAQVQLTQSQLQYQLAKYNSWIKWSEWAYARALIQIP